jgi:hypothetical protein
MSFLRVLATLALVTGCSAVPEAPLDDPQEPARPTPPALATEDGELTRLRPVTDALPDDVLADRLDRAHVAFVGEAVSIAHRDVVLPELGAVPHTFVTYRVDDPVKGATTGEQVTLRFLGGPAEDGVRTLSVSEIPEFEVGERDLLFVREDNGRHACPLIDCRSGRLKVEGDQILAPTGHLLVTLDDGRTRFAERPSDVPPAEHDEGVRPRPAPLGTPIVADDLVRRLHRPGPTAASISVSLTHPIR